MEMALNLASVTCLKPFLRPFQESGYIPTTMQEGPIDYGITGAKSSRSESYLMLGTAGTTTTKNKDGSIIQAPVEVSQRQSIPRARLRADDGQHEAKCEYDAREYGQATPKVIRVSRTVQVQRGSDQA